MGLSAMLRNNKLFELLPVYSSLESTSTANLNIKRHNNNNKNRLLSSLFH